MDTFEAIGIHSAPGFQLLAAQRVNVECLNVRSWATFP